MKKIILAFLTFVLIFSLSENANADDHMGPSNLQIQLCKLNEGVTMNDYDSLINEYFKWAKKNDVEVFFARQTPLYPQNSFIRAGYDFVELLNTSGLLRNPTIFLTF